MLKRNIMLRLVVGGVLVVAAFAVSSADMRGVHIGLAQNATSAGSTIAANPTQPSGSPVEEKPFWGTFWDDFGKLLNSDLQRGNPTSYLVFAVATGIASFLIFLLDVLVVTTGRRGFLEVSHSWGRSTGFAIIWFIGGSIAGGLGLVARIYETSDSIGAKIAETATATVVATPARPGLFSEDARLANFEPRTLVFLLYQKGRDSHPF
jgi:hypothetical protein